VDTLIIESTYGANATAHEIEYHDEVERFAEGINRVLNRDGVVLAPSFALGRTQEVLNMIARLQESGRIPYVPVYASGMGRAIYEIYSRYAGELKRRARLAPLEEFEAVGDVWDPRVVRELTSEPAIIVATSGMMLENTPSAMIAERLVTEPRNGIFFVGYCDPATLGYKVRNAKKGDRFIFRLGGSPVTVQCEDIQWYYFSAHAHRQDLVEVVDRIQSKNLLFVHGDPPAVEWMYHNSGEGRRKFMPRVGERIALRT
jgi:predicted metal-dependent RNase